MIVETTARALDRGQTTIDFAVGASILLVSASAVVALTPGLFPPVSGERAADPLTSDRLADHLRGTHFVDDASIEAFFAGTDGSSSLGPPDTTVNVSMRTQPADEVATVDGPTGTTAAERGPPVPAHATNRTSHAERVIVYGGEAHWVDVRVW